nr:hypothetical protein [Tanacetum cinerariifolium]
MEQPDLLEAGPQSPIQTPLVPQDEDESEEQPLPPIVSPTAESPGYVVESDLKEDPEEYEDDESDNGPLTILWTGEKMEMMMMAIYSGMTPMMRMRMRRRRRST